MDVYVCSTGWMFWQVCLIVCNIPTAALFWISDLLPIPGLLDQIALANRSAITPANWWQREMTVPTQKTMLRFLSVCVLTVGTLVLKHLYHASLNNLPQCWVSFYFSLSLVALIGRETIILNDFWTDLHWKQLKWLYSVCVNFIFIL